MLILGKDPRFCRYAIRTGRCRPATVWLSRCKSACSLLHQTLVRRIIACGEKYDEEIFAASVPPLRKSDVCLWSGRDHRRHPWRRYRRIRRRTAECGHRRRGSSYYDSAENDHGCRRKLFVRLASYRDLPADLYDIGIQERGSVKHYHHSGLYSHGQPAAICWREPAVCRRPGRAVVVDTTNNTTASTFDDALLQNVPSGRDTFSTVAQAPGAASSDFDIAGSQSFQQSVMQVHGSLPGDQVL